MATSADHAAATIEQFIRTEFQVGEGDPLFSRDVHLFETGYVDSIGFAQLLAFIESTFGVAIDVDDLMNDDFTTINGISRLISATPDGDSAEVTELEIAETG